MRCYRCGALINEGTDICPECGFELNSPVELHMYEKMNNIRIYDDEMNVLWSGEGTDTAYIDVPEKRKIRICWGSLIEHEIRISIRNGEAYRFERRFSKLAKSMDDAQVIKTRTIPKKNK